METKNDTTITSLPERIILAIDITCEMSELFTKTKTKLQVAAQALTMFVQMKTIQYTNQQTQFALVLLAPSGVQWMIDFTTDIAYVLSAIDGLTVAMGEEDKVLDMSKLLQLVQEQFYRGNQSLGTFTRVFCIFGRSTQIPIYSMGRDCHAALLQHPGFGFDVLYLHQKPRADNHVREIFDAFGQTDVVESSTCPNYLFARHHKAQVVMRDVAMLLQHPGLRQPQPKNFDEMKEMIRFGVAPLLGVTTPTGGGGGGGSGGGGGGGNSNVVMDAAVNEMSELDVVEPPLLSTVVQVLPGDVVSDAVIHAELVP